MSSPKRRIETDVMKLYVARLNVYLTYKSYFVCYAFMVITYVLYVCSMMTDHEVTLVNDSMMEFFVSFRGPKDSMWREWRE